MQQLGTETMEQKIFYFYAPETTIKYKYNGKSSTFAELWGK